MDPIDIRLREPGDRLNQPMTKRLLHAIHLALLVWLPMGAEHVLSQETNAQQAIQRNTNDRKVLFFDLWKLDAWENTQLRQGEPEWISDCDYVDPRFPKDGIYFPSVWRDSSSGKFRLIYSIRWSPFTMMIAQSDDGVHWQPHAANQIQPSGEKLAPNHLLTAPSAAGGGIYHDPQKSDGYAFRIFGRQRGEPVYQRALDDPEHRWHAIAKQEGPKRYIDEGVTLVSKDGLDWKLKTGGKWNWQDDDWYPEPPVFAFWNQHTKQHVLAARPGWGDRRQCLRTSNDLVRWSAPELQFQPDSLDTQAPLGMYGMPVTPVGNGAGYVGLLWIFRNSSSEPVGSFNQFFGTMDAELVYSYDGVRFFRSTHKPFLKRNPIPKPGCLQVRPCSLVHTDQHVLIYSEGHRAAHGRERSERQQTDQPLTTLMLHRLRKDGWMYLASQGDWARIQTKPFALLGESIQLNADASFGEVQFQLTDERSQPIDGFTFDDCVALRRDDTLAHQLTWKSQKNLPRKQPVRLELKFRQANIYSLSMDHHFLDAHDMWLLKDGKPLPDQRRFDF